MADVSTVARYILDQRGEMTAMKLQKLAYYSHAWNLVWDEQPLVENPLQAWANGPVFPDLYQQHRGKFTVRPTDITPRGAELTASEKETIDAVLNFYGPRSAHDLSHLTHREDPWRIARGDLTVGDSSREAISNASLAEYYGGLVLQQD